MDASLVVPGHGFVDDAAILKEELANFHDALEYVVAEVTLFTRPVRPSKRD